MLSRSQSFSGFFLMFRVQHSQHEVSELFELVHVNATDGPFQPFALGQSALLPGKIIEQGLE